MVPNYIFQLSVMLQMEKQIVETIIIIESLQFCNSTNNSLFHKFYNYKWNICERIFFLADFPVLHCLFTKGKEKTFWKQILSTEAKHSVWKHYTSTSCNFSLKTCILPEVTSWSVMRITWQIGITVRPFARWRWLHSHLWGIKTLLRALPQILMVFCRVGWIINRCPLSFELPSAVTG